jgi:hypothetical protein
MNNLYSILILLVIYYFFINNKESFEITSLERDLITNYKNFFDTQKIEQTKIGSTYSSKRVFLDPLFSLLGLINTVISPNESEKDTYNKVKEGLKNQNVNIDKLKSDLVDCIIQILDSPSFDDSNNATKVLVDPTFSSKMNNIFLELNKIDIALLSSTVIGKTQFCNAFSDTAFRVYKKEDSEKRAKMLSSFNKILTAYSNLIMMFYLFILKNIDNISNYCGQERTQTYKEFKKMFETIKLAVITKDDLDKKCPKANPAEICASYIKEASTCNTSTSSLKSQRTILIILVVILLTALGYKMFV